MVITHEEVETLRETVRRHLVSTKWISNMHRAVGHHGVGGDPKQIARETWGGLSREELQAAREGRSERDDILVFLHRNLHLLIPCGFDEVRIEPGPVSELTEAMNVEYKKTFPDAPAHNWLGGARGAGLALAVGFRCRDATSGQWFSKLVMDYASQTLCIQSRSTEKRWRLRELVNACQAALRAPGHPAVMALPNLWRPPETHPSIELFDTTRAILQALQARETTLRELPWQQLEDVVAELLRQRGLEVQMTPRGPDGGRDILARGKLMLGEPAVLAVEVRNTKVVGLDDVRSRLYANREFPMLMFATSGRFSAGVVREKYKPENFLRLWLRNGVALNEWIHEYWEGQPAAGLEPRLVKNIDEGASAPNPRSRDSSRYAPNTSTHMATLVRRPR